MCVVETTHGKHLRCLTGAAQRYVDRIGSSTNQLPPIGITWGNADHNRVFQVNSGPAECARVVPEGHACATIKRLKLKARIRRVETRGQRVGQRTRKAVER